MSRISSVVSQPTLAHLGGDPQNPTVPPWIRVPFFPTMPWVSSNPNVGSQIRYYSTGLLSTDADVSVGSESIRTVQFDIPCRVVAINGACVNTAQNGALPLGVTGLDCFLFRAEYGTGDKIHTQPRVASTVLGTGQNPGEVGGAGIAVDTGGVLIIGITPINPIPANFRIDITFHVLEIRGTANFVQGGR